MNFTHVRLDIIVQYSLNANTRYSQQKNHSQVAIVPKTQTVIRNFNDQHVTAVYKNKREGLSPSGKCVLHVARHTGVVHTYL